MISGIHAELWRLDHIFGDVKLADVFILNEHWLTELIYRTTITPRGIFVHRKHIGIQWQDVQTESKTIGYLLEIQRTREEIRIDFCEPKPDLPGYPETDYHPIDFPTVLMDWDELLEASEKVNDDVIV